MANILTRWRDRRSLAVPSPELKALFSSGPTEAGVSVSSEQALTIPAVFSCVQVLSMDVARTPIRFRQETGPDTYVDATAHDLFDVLSVLPNPEMTAYQFKALMMWSLLTYGRAYAQIVRQDGRIVSLWPLKSDQMTVDRAPDGRKRWTYHAGRTVMVWMFDASMPPILELTSPSPVQVCRELLGTALASSTFLAKFFANNGKPAGILTAAGAISDATAQRLRDYWATNYAGSKNAWKVPVVDNGLTFTPISQTNDEAQMAEVMRALNEQIAGVFRVPVWKIGDLSKANYSNMQSGELAYVQSSLDPYFVLWEEALQRDLLTARQFERYQISFDRNALVRNDIAQLHQSLSSGIQNGYLSQNDARRALGLNPIPDGDVYLINSALQPVGAPKEEPHVA